MVYDWKTFLFGHWIITFIVNHFEMTYYDKVSWIYSVLFFIYSIYFSKCLFLIFCKILSSMLIPHRIFREKSIALQKQWQCHTLFMKNLQFSAFIIKNIVEVDNTSHSIFGFELLTYGHWFQLKTLYNIKQQIYQFHRAFVEFITHTKA